MTSFLTHRVIFPPYMLFQAWRHTGHGAPYRLTEFNADMDRAAQIPLTKPDVPKRIYMLWLQGLEDAPEIVKVSYASWVAANPDWEVILLDRQSLKEWVDISDMHPEVPFTSQSNVIRLRLLSQYGGVWADATTLCMRPLDDWLGRHTGKGFFAFAPHSRTRIVDSWFMAGRPGATVLENWRHSFSGYIAHRKNRIAYFCLHHTFEYLYYTNAVFRDVWDATPKLNAHGPQMLKWILSMAPDQVVTPTSEEMAQVPLFKLNRRPGPEDLEHALPKLAEFGLEPYGLKSAQ